MYSKSDFSSLLKEKILVLDGAMGTMIQSHNLKEADYKGNEFIDWQIDLKGNNDLLTLTKPDLISSIHQSFIEAGSDIIETNTFNSNSISQSDYGLEERTYDLNFQGAKLAKEVATKSKKEILVAGVLGPTNRTASLSPEVSDLAARNISFDELKQDYEICINGLMDGGADILLIETIDEGHNSTTSIYKDIFYLML